MSIHQGRGNHGTRTPRRRGGYFLAVAVVVVALAGAAAAVIYDTASPAHRAARKPQPLAAPRCPAAAGEAPGVTAAGASIRLPRMLTAVQVSADGRFTFAATGHRIDVLRNHDGRPSQPPVRVVPLRTAARAEQLTPDGRYLLVAAGAGTTVISVRVAVDPAGGDPIVAVLAAPAGGLAAASAVAVSPSGRYAFVALESANRVAVFRLQGAIARGFRPGDYAGSVPVTDPAGIAASPDGRWLYVISKSRGTISVLSQQAAGTKPSGAVTETVAAGCSPSQVITSPDGTVVWVTARDSNALVGFSAAGLAASDRHPVVAVVPVGQSPVGEVLLDGGRTIVTLDVTGFAPGGGNIAVVSTAAATAATGRSRALLRMVRTTLLPRHAVAEQAPAGGFLLVTYDHSRVLQAIKAATFR